MSDNAESSSNTVAIISHFTLIGWIIALVMHSNNKTNLGSFYLRQMLGLMILSVVVSLVGRYFGILYWILTAGVFVLWILSLIGAVQNKESETPVIGKYFQDWFKTLA